MKRWVALPQSLLSDVPGLREKTVRAGYIGRACAIFGVERIYIYDDTKGEEKEQGRLLKTLLEYMELPQYLRKRVFGERRELQYAGLLPPLRTPHHKTEARIEELKVGEVREGIVVKAAGRSFVDIGMSKLVPLEGDAQDGSRITVRLKEPHPNPLCEPIDQREIGDYWGYIVKEVSSLSRLAKSLSSTTIVLTSRYGRPIRKAWWELVESLKESSAFLLVVGAPKRGLIEILSHEGVKPRDLTRFFLNTMPGQKTATIRSDEALLASLALLNLAVLEAEGGD